MIGVLDATIRPARERHFQCSAGPPPDGIVAISDAVLEWLADGVGVPPPTELAGARVWDVPWTRAAVRGAHAQRLGPATLGDRFAQLWWLRVCGSTGFEQLAAAAVWDPDELLFAAARCRRLPCCPPCSARPAPWRWTGWPKRSWTPTPTRPRWRAPRRVGSNRGSGCSRDTSSLTNRPSPRCGMRRSTGWDCRDCTSTSGCGC